MSWLISRSHLSNGVNFFVQFTMNGYAMMWATSTFSFLTDQVVVNGMSPSNRGSKWANSGLVVEFHPEDIVENNINFPAAEPTDVAPELALMHFQEQLEKLCYLKGGATQTAPVQRMNDFIQGKVSQTLPASSYAPGIQSSALNEWLPKGISSRLQEGFKIFDRSSKGFLTNEALLLGVETRTSSPIKGLFL